ncbi:class I adenylate-forming enzyme family protein [Paenibacillus beijingensis]|uniref:class I adenylate-forming enzyme family protein n=1 Tax=Paenibacillus beijingensis TaxID=1126833 RepID=UPI000696E2F7|nr:class I adenylate-forming enzyme family protein [Paenibacillus beijingensis]
MFNLSAKFLEYLNKTPQKDFLVFYGKDSEKITYSYNEVLTRVIKVAIWLEEQGVKRGDRIVTAMCNQPEQVIIYLAAWAKGVCVVPVNMSEDDNRIGYIIEHSRAKVVFVQDSYLETIKQITGRIDRLPLLFRVGECDQSIFQQPSDLGNDPIESIIDSSDEDEALIVYTSGTTGNPKGVILQQKHLVKDAEAIAECNHIDFSTKLMCVLPIHHVNGIIVTIVTSFTSGSTLILNERFSVREFWRRASIEKANIISLVPTLLEYLMEANEDISKYDLRSLRHVICGAGPLLVDTVMAFENKFNIPVIHAYGLSETTCFATFLPTDLPHEERKYWLTHFGYPSIGVPIKYNELSIIDVTGNEVGEGIRGEIIIRGETVMKEYDRSPEANASVFRLGNGRFCTGDEGFYQYDERGRKYFFITGRIKELIIRAGVNIAPVEIDEVICKYSKVRYALSFPFDHKYYGEEIAAYVIPKVGMEVTENEVLEHCRQHLPFSKQPKVIIFGNAVPYTSTGKPKRLELKKKLKEQLTVYRDIQFKEGN